MALATPAKTATAEPARRRPCAATSRPSIGTIISMYPYFAMTAAAKATAAATSHAVEPGERVTHHIDTASAVSAATS